MTRRLPVLFALLLAALWALPASRADGETPTNSYTVTELGTLSTASGVNAAGQVVGGFSGRAVLWDNGVSTDLGTLGGLEAIALGINNSGQVAGRSTLASGITHAFRWDAATGMRDLGTLGGAYSGAAGINDAGQVVGWSHLANGQTRAFLWKSGKMFDLGTLPGGTSSAAYGINASGQVVGYAGDGYSVRAFLWTPTVPNGTTGAMVALPSSANSAAYGLEASGAAVGQVGDVPYLWDSAGAHALPLLDLPVEWWDNTGIYGGGGVAINASRRVVGYALHWWWGGEDQGGTFSSAVTWDGVNGTRQLGALIDQDVWLDGASAINSLGVIAAEGSGMAYVLTPSPLPVRARGLWAKPRDARVELAWSPSYGAASPTTYTVKRAAESGGPYTIVASNITGASYEDTAVVNGATYHYVVSTVNAYGESPPSNEARATPEAAPDAPTGLTATAGHYQVSLSWNAGAGADYYNVYHSTTSGGPYYFAGGTFETTFVDDGGGWGLDAGTTYYYVVTGVNATGESPYSNEAGAIPTAPPPPPAPGGLTAVPGDTLVALTWSASAGADYYAVKTSLTSGGPYTVWGGVLDPSATVPGLTNGLTYYFVVSAVNATGESPNSSEVSATPNGPPPPATPTNLTATGGKRKVTLRWAQSTTPGITKNRVYRATTSGGPYSLRATVNPGTSFTDRQVSAGVTYYYVVTALKSGLESAHSNEASARPRR